jgi:membrane protease YdiL (CAAX protease family)
MTKKLLSILIIILTANFLLSYALKSIIIETEFSQHYVLKNILKLGFVVLSIFLIRKLSLKFQLFKYSIYIVPICIILLYLSFQNVEQSIENSNSTITSNQNLLFFLSCLLVGAFEELFFRVYIFHSLLSNLKGKSLLKIITITSLIFALAHITNMLNPDVVAISVFVQIVFAFGLGFIFQAIYLRFKNIILPICLHGIFNYFGTYKTRMFDTISEEIAEIKISEFLLSLGFTLFFILVLITISYFLLIPIIKDWNEEKKYVL